MVGQNENRTPQEIVDDLYLSLNDDVKDEGKLIAWIKDFSEYRDRGGKLSDEKLDQIIETLREEGYSGVKEKGYQVSEAIEGKSVRDMQQEIDSGDPSFNKSDIANELISQTISGLEKSSDGFPRMVHPNMAYYYASMYEKMALQEQNKDVESGFKEIDVSTFDFEKSGVLFKKTAKLDKSNIEIAEDEQEVVTKTGDHEETRNTANPGDRIVTGPEGERYVITADKFEKLYEENPNNPEEFQSKGTVRGIVLTEDVSFDAPWGEKMHIRAGGTLVKNGDDVYGIDKKAFAKTYGRADETGQVFVGMDKPLEEQRIATNSPETPLGPPDAPLGKERERHQGDIAVRHSMTLAHRLDSQPARDVEHRPGE